MSNLLTIEKIKKNKNIINNSSFFSISEWILSNYKNIEKIDIEKLSKITNTSKSTITRFCKEVGYSGYKEFKFTLLNEINNEVKYIENIKGFTISDSSLIDSLEKNIAFFNSKKDLIQKISNEVLASKRIVLYGFGGNSHLIKIFHHYIVRMGINSVFLRDRDDQFALSNSINDFDKNENTLNIIISYKFRDEIWDSILSNLYKSNQKIIIITSQKSQNLKKLSEFKNSDLLVEIPFNEGKINNRDNAEVSFLLFLMLIVESLLKNKNELFEKQDII